MGDLFTTRILEQILIIAHFECEGGEAESDQANLWHELGKLILLMITPFVLKALTESYCPATTFFSRVDIISNTLSIVDFISIIFSIIQEVPVIHTKYRFTSVLINIFLG